MQVDECLSILVREQNMPAPPKPFGEMSEAEQSALKTDFRIVRGSALFYGDDEPGQKALLRIEACFESLKPYIRHHDSCEWDPEDGGDCTCGLLPLIQDL